MDETTRIQNSRAIEPPAPGRMGGEPITPSIRPLAERKLDYALKILRAIPVALRVYRHHIDAASLERKIDEIEAMQ